MLAERERLKAELASLQGLLTGRLRLGVPALGSASLFAPLVAKFRSLYPQIEIDLQQHGSERLEAAVKSGEIEMGATLYPIRRDFDSQVVCEEPLLALLPVGHPLAGRGKVKLRELAGNPFILFEQGFVLYGRILAACRKRGIVLTEAARGANADFIIALVAAGLGVALMPRLEMRIRSNLQTVETVEVDEKDLRWKLGLIWRRGVSLSPPAKHWLAFVREQVNSRKSLE
ncbi:LysR substrate-binding domain-containing protein [Verrucomicrobiota bacterium sgz303538]